jgi:dipeptidyl aminopeptidase/acylaminoacyl peptidase
MVELGIADENRLAVMGQSFGGYTVYSLVTQTNRFKAAIAVAGITNIGQSYLEFDPNARGHPGIEHQRSANWSIWEKGSGFGVPPYEDPAHYWRNSPLAYVDRVETPLLMIHGELDSRGSLSQADTFFYSLYRQGKTARLLRYWGEGHAVAASPANIRNILDETFAWLDRYLGPAKDQTASIVVALP